MSGRAVIVTGIAGGIGDAIGRHLRQEGWFVVGVDRWGPAEGACDWSVSFDLLEAGNGCVVNIGSVHAQATKREFVTYATSKAALHGLTRALAVDLGPGVRAECLAPAAISTPMLLEGFAGKQEAFGALQGCHPAGRIGEPREVARAASFLSSQESGFLTGTTLYLDGGGLCRLHNLA